MNYDPNISFGMLTIFQRFWINAVTKRIARLVFSEKGPVKMGAEPQNLAD